VEDNQGIREGIEDYLRLLGWDVLTAQHGREALDRISEMDERPCLILLDISMPVMDGPTFRRHQLEDPQLCDVPVCVISGESSIKETAGLMGVDGFLAKPFDFKVLADTVNRVAKSPA
jgi:CheY-like chemotaxis protein